MGASPDVPANQIEPPQGVQTAIAADAWRIGKDITRLTPYSWGRLCEDELLELRQHLADLRDTHPEACAGIDHALALGGPGPNYGSSRDLQFRGSDDGFAPTEDKADLYRQAVSHGTLRTEEDPEVNVAAHTERPIENAVGAIFKNLSKAKLRFTPNRIARALPAALLDETGDRTLVETLFASSIDLGIAAGSYAAYPLRELKERLTSGHAIDLEPTLTDLSDTAVIGSAGVPELHHYRASIAHLLAQAKAAIKEVTRPLHERHNAFLCYVTYLLLQGTGYRFVHDPFFCFGVFDLARWRVIISDKAVSPSQETRFVPLPDLCVAIIEIIVIHLRSLAAELEYRGDRLCEDIREVLTSERASLTMPFLFFLEPATGNGPTCYRWESVTYSGFRARTDWPWHPSAHRHLISTQLRIYGDVPPEYIDHLLGHWLEGESPLGSSSILRLEDYFDPLRRGLERLLKECGFEQIRGLWPHRPPKKTWPISKSSVPAHPPLLGPFARAARREEEITTDRAAVERAIVQACNELGITDDSADQARIKARLAEHDQSTRDALVDRVRELVIDSCDGTLRLRSRLKMLHRFLRILRLSYKGMYKQIGRVFAPADDPPAIADLTGCSLHIGTRVRDEFVDWVGRIDPAKLDAFDTAGIALLSAIILGGLVTREMQDAYVNALGKGDFFRVNGIDWLMFSFSADKKSNFDAYESRYIGDSITRMLYARAARSLDNCHPEQHKSLKTSVRGRARALMLGSSWGKDLINLDRLSKIMGDDLVTRCSGITTALLKGRTECTCLPDGPWLRLITGLRLEVPPSDFGAAVTEGNPISIDVSRPVKASKTDALVHKQLQMLRNTLNDVEATKEGLSKQKSLRHAATKKRMRAALKSLEHDFNEKGTVPLLFLLVQYGLHLIDHGGIRESNLKPATVSKYMLNNAADLLHEFGNQDPADLDPDDRADVYAAVLGPQSDERKNRVRRANVALTLYYFDHFLCQRGDVTPLDWGEIEPGLFLNMIRVDANILTPAELGIMRSSLRSDQDDEPLVRQVMQQMADAALRFGEGYRLAEQDCRRDHGVPVFLIHNSKRGSVKSRAGVRIAPALRAPVINNSHRRSEKSGWVALPPGTSTHLRDPLRRAVHSKLAQRCRLVSGDPRSRPHHFRHAWATDALARLTSTSHPLLEIVTGTKGNAAYQPTSDHFKPGLSRLPEKSAHSFALLSRSLGHAQPTTTVRSYFHLPEVLAAAELDAACTRTLPTESLGSWLGFAGSTVRTSKLHHDLDVLDGTGRAIVLQSLGRPDVWPKDRAKPRLAKHPAQPNEAGVTSTKAPRLPILVSAVCLLLDGFSCDDAATELGIGADWLSSFVNRADRMASITRLKLLGSCRWDGTRLISPTPEDLIEARRGVRSIRDALRLRDVIDALEAFSARAATRPVVTLMQLQALLLCSWDDRQRGFVFDNPRAARWAVAVLTELGGDRTRIEFKVVVATREVGEDPPPSGPYRGSGEPVTKVVWGLPGVRLDTSAILLIYIIILSTLGEAEPLRRDE